MKFSEEFEQRLSSMLQHYPTKRSVLVPTLLYAQDEVGFLSDEVIGEIAGRHGTDAAAAGLEWIGRRTRRAGGRRSLVTRRGGHVPQP